MSHIDDHWQPDFYQSHSDFQFSSTLALFPKIKFPAKGKLLDIGSGDGKITATIAKAHPKLVITGIDSSASMIAFAQKTYAHVSHLSFQQLDAHSLATDETFDCIVSFWTVAWLIDHGLFLRHCYERLNSGGHLFLFAAENHLLIKQAVDTAIADARWAQYFTEAAFHENYCSLMLYKELIDMHRLKGLKVTRHNTSYPFQTSEALQHYIAAWLPHLQRLPEEQKESFIDAIVSHYQTQRTLNNENPLSIDCTGFIVYGEKP